MARLLVILGQPLSHFPCSDTHHWILVCIVLRRALEYFDSERSLLQTLDVVVTGVLHHIAKEN